MGEPVFNVKAVLFDLDGVLVDACDWHKDALNDAIEEIAGFRINEEEHVSMFNGLPTSKKMEILVGQGRITVEQSKAIPPLKQKKTIEILLDKVENDESKIEMLTRLMKSGILTACVTNSIRETTEIMLNKSGVRGLFDAVVTNEDVRHPKPHAEPYVTAMVEIGRTPQECLIVEDSDKGYEAANKTGAKIWRVKNAEEVNWCNIKEHL